MLVILSEAKDLCSLLAHTNAWGLRFAQDENRNVVTYLHQ